MQGRRRDRIRHYPRREDRDRTHAAQRCPRHSNLEPVEVVVKEVRSAQSDHPTRVVVERRCRACGYAGRGARLSEATERHHEIRSPALDPESRLRRVDRAFDAAYPDEARKLC